LNLEFLGLAKAIYNKNMFFAGFDYGYKFTLLTLSKNCGFAVPIFPSLIFSKKMADTTYCGPPFI
jgi:hypothetical protein